MHSYVFILCSSQDPQPIQFRGNVEAKKFRASCLQHTNFTGSMKGISHISEDCLYLNIYTPNVSDTNLVMFK